MKLTVLHIVDEGAHELCSPLATLRDSVSAFAAIGIECEVITYRPKTSEMDCAHIVHIHGWGYAAARIAAKAARSAKKRYVISPHGSFHDGIHRRNGFFSRLGALLRDRPLIRGAAAITGVNPHETTALQQAGVNGNIHLLPYGTKVSEASLAAPPSKVLLILDPVTPLSGGAMLLKAIAELGPLADGWNVIFADGTSDTARSLEAAVARKGAGKRVRFNPKSDAESWRKLLQEATVVVAPWLHVSFPSSAMRALAHSVPVLATRCVAIDAIGCEAMRVCEPNRTSLREALRGMLTMPDAQAHALRQEAHDFARSNLDWRIIAPRFAEFYACLLGSKPGVSSSSPSKASAGLNETRKSARLGKPDAVLVGDAVGSARHT